MNYSFFSHIRDIVFLFSLLFLLKTAYDRNYTFLSDHKKSIIHELDRSTIDQIYAAQRHVHFLQEYDELNTGTLSHAIADIKERLATIEEKYKTNSPGLALLGPIGSAAIVAKEEQLQQKLLVAINDLSKIAYTINKSQEPFTPAETVENGLEINKQLLQTL
jgi:hypothetical protein